MREPPPPLSPDVALFLDFDGTLTDIAPTPDAISVAPDLSDLLQDVAWGLNGALAIVSGRKIAVLDDYLAAAVTAVAGVSGAERRTVAGLVHRVSVDPSVLTHARETLAQFAREHPGVYLEDKGLGLALHFRQAPHFADASAAAVAQSAADSLGRLEKVASNMVMELRPVSINKAACVSAYMNEPPFAGRRPVFVGDDPVDEEAFTEVNRTNGYSVIVGARENTAALHRLPSVATLHEWLRAFVTAQVRDDAVLMPRPKAPPRHHGRAS